MSVFYFLFLLQFICTNGMNYSGKTPYSEAFSKEQYDFINDARNYRIDGCEPVQINIFLRHGARYPGKSQLDEAKRFLKQLEIFKVHSRLRRMLEELFDSFQGKPPYGLSDLGAREHQQIGRRFRTRYANLFNVDESEHTIHTHFNLISSSKNRSIDSGVNFVRGLYGDDHTLVNWLARKFEINDTMMRQFDFCERYVNEVLEADKTNPKSEGNLFNKGKEMKEMVRRFKERNDIAGMDVSPNDLLKIFTLCNIEHAHGMRENWCQLFDRKDYEPLGYMNDLKAYWLKAYGHRLNSKVMLLFVQDMFYQMEKAIRDDSDKNTVLLRFGHAENMLPLIATMGFFKDHVPLKHDNYQELANRKFKTGRVSPFAANMAFVLHKCPSSSSSNIYDQYKVNILVNEMPIELFNLGERLPCASQQDAKSVCDYAAFKRLLDPYTSETVDQVCRIKTVSTNEEL